MANEFTIKVDGDLSSLDKQIKSLLDSINKTLAVSGAKLSKDQESQLRRYQDLHRNRVQGDKNEAYEQRQSSIDRGFDPKRADAIYNKKISNINKESGNSVEAELLRQIDETLKNTEKDQKKSNSGNDRLLNTLASVFAIQQIGSAAAGYIDRRANFSSSTYGTTPGSNALNGVMAGMGTGAMVGGLPGMIAGATTAAIVYYLQDASQKDQRDLSFSANMAKAAGSIGRYGVMTKQDALDQGMQHRNGINGMDLSMYYEQAAGVGISPSQFLGMTEQGWLQGGTKGGKHGMMTRGYNSAVLNQGYGFNIDQGMQKYTQGDVVEATLKMLNKLTSIDSKQTTLILANQKIAEFSRINQQQLSTSNNANTSLGSQQMVALQHFLGDANLDTSTLRAQIQNGIGGDPSGGMGVLKYRAASETFRKHGMLDKANDIVELRQLIERNLNDPVLGNDYANSLINIVRTSAPGNFSKLNLRTMFGGDVSQENINKMFAGQLNLAYNRSGAVGDAAITIDGGKKGALTNSTKDQSALAFSELDNYEKNLATVKNTEALERLTRAQEAANRLSFHEKQAGNKFYRHPNGM